MSNDEPKRHMRFVGARKAHTPTLVGLDPEATSHVAQRAAAEAQGAKALARDLDEDLTKLARATNAKIDGVRRQQRVDSVKFTQLAAKVVTKDDLAQLATKSDVEGVKGELDTLKAELLKVAGSSERRIIGGAGAAVGVSQIALLLMTSGHEKLVGIGALVLSVSALAAYFVRRKKVKP